MIRANAFDEIQFEHSPKEANMMAHKLARFFFSSKSYT
jgi:hypothetical protein